MTMRRLISRYESYLNDFESLRWSGENARAQIFVLNLKFLI